MSMNYLDVIKAYEEAERIMRLADMNSNRAAKLLVGRLQSSNVSRSYLRALKAELSMFNAKTGSWKK